GEQWKSQQQMHRLQDLDHAICPATIQIVDVKHDPINLRQRRILVLAGLRQQQAELLKIPPHQTHQPQVPTVVRRRRAVFEESDELSSRRQLGQLRANSLNLLLGSAQGVPRLLLRLPFGREGLLRERGVVLGLALDPHLLNLVVGTLQICHQGAARFGLGGKPRRESGNRHHHLGNRSARALQQVLDPPWPVLRQPGHAERRCQRRHQQQPAFPPARTCKYCQRQRIHPAGQRAHLPGSRLQLGERSLQLWKSESLRRYAQLLPHVVVDYQVLEIVQQRSHLSLLYRSFLDRCPQLGLRIHAGGLRDLQRFLRFDRQCALLGKFAFQFFHLLFRRILAFVQPGEELVEYLTNQIRPEIRVQIMPSVESNLNDLFVEDLARFPRQRAQMLVDQVNEIGLPSTPRSEQPDGKRHPRVLCGDELCQVPRIHADAQLIVERRVHLAPTISGAVGGISGVGLAKARRVGFRELRGFPTLWLHRAKNSVPFHLVVFGDCCAEECAKLAKTRG